eukprot:COSAG03_NODE_2029_length_3204_cov_11.004831_2_plen_195_part_00
MSKRSLAFGSPHRCSPALSTAAAQRALQRSLPGRCSAGARAAHQVVCHNQQDRWLRSIGDSDEQGRRAPADPAAHHFSMERGASKGVQLCTPQAVSLHVCCRLTPRGLRTGGTRIRNGLFCGGRTAPVLLVCRYWDWSQIEGMSQARLASEGFRLEIPHARAVTVHFLQFWKPYTTLAITPCEWRCHSVESRLD